MLLLCGAAMANVRRIHRYLTKLRGLDRTTSTATDSRGARSAPPALALPALGRIDRFFQSFAWRSTADDRLQQQAVA